MELIGIFLIFLLVFINGFFVASEFAMVSLRPSRLEELVKENRSMALLTKKAIGKIDDMLSVCQVGITVASLLLGWIGEAYFARIVGGIFSLFTIPAEAVTIHSISIGVAFTLITLFHVILGELVPKTIAIQNTEAVALGVSGPMWLFYYLFFPVTFVMNRLAGGVLTIFRLQRTGDKYVHSPEELMIIIEEQRKNGRIDNEEMRLIQKTFDFSEHTAKDVMTHRLSIVGISQDSTIDKILPLIAEHSFSRYPIYDGTLDKITGIIHVQKYLKWQADHATSKGKKEKITAIMERDFAVVPESMSIERVMSKLREKKQHMAIVIDEYGGVAGLLTLEDIIEEFFGEIRDETDTDEKDTPAVTKKSKPILIDGETEIDSLTGILEGEEPRDMEEVRTIAGYFLEKNEDMPKEGSSVRIKKGILKVKKMEGNKIVSILFTPKGAFADESDSESERELAGEDR
ncbi:hemolysin family protein [Leptospira ilyithenensis]|uniref:HlyC/CorC family transporter n=1 Tax=Leptospira ilyithenensis TaxID=2484901 RepID=A0A4R9LJE3_9LEPT|nr:hemolysin family protein [Leptospira ilyithenensis]TGN06996.1 HlyC/CorC family transporter [Leptospira ilyithenensis]